MVEGVCFMVQACCNLWAREKRQDSPIGMEFLTSLAIVKPFNFSKVWKDLWSNSWTEYSDQAIALVLDWMVSNSPL